MISFVVLWTSDFIRKTNLLYFIFFFKQKTAYEMRISDWSSDVCSSDLCEKTENLASCGVFCCLNGCREQKTGIESAFLRRGSSNTVRGRHCPSAEFVAKHDVLDRNSTRMKSSH